MSTQNSVPRTIRLPRCQTFHACCVRRTAQTAGSAPLQKKGACTVTAHNREGNTDLSKGMDNAGEARQGQQPSARIYHKTRTGGAFELQYIVHLLIRQ